MNDTLNTGKQALANRTFTPARYNIVNNSLGWLCFLVAAVTYLLTLEPTASFWDCPEFIAQGAKLEIGHPPGNPIFMLTARFFVTIFGGDMHNAALAINTMSALLSAGTILLLFWTITHLVKKIVVRDDATEISLPRMMVIMGAGLCGALAYTWSDTFWFSAVEAEVYAFSSFCTALVFWLILKWENRADSSLSDRYLILIAYVIGVSIAVHLLNLLCIPAIVLVIYYRKFKKVNVKGSLLALCISFFIVAAILFGLVPGFIKVAQGVDLMFVNGLGLPINSGVFFYVVMLSGIFIATIYCLYRHKASWLIKSLFLLSMILSGLVLISDSVAIWVLLILALAAYLFLFCPKIPYRIFNVITISVFVIFIGYSSYALILIRASANTPMNQNAPDNVFTLGSYLNREQYGQQPLLYGPVWAETPVIQPVAYDEAGNYVYGAIVDEDGQPLIEIADGYVRNEKTGMPFDDGEYVYTRAVKTSPDEPDRYVKAVWKPDLRTTPEFNMLFTRMYSNRDEHVQNYKTWALIENEDLADWNAKVPESAREMYAQMQYMPLPEFNMYTPNMVNYTMYQNADGEPVPTYDRAWKPSFTDNLRYFFNYQFVHMYWRYFMWNFAGRQNDIAGNGEPHLGNWISGIPVIDNMRLGDQSLLPEEYTTGNKGHNVFYMLPLLLGILGLIWQALMLHPANPNRGIEQFWVIFFLFFMTGIAIVLYLNQPPGQPRERDYAFAGSFYAFAIWIGMGVPAIWSIMRSCLIRGKKGKDTKDNPAPGVSDEKRRKLSLASACVGCVAGIIVPLQMVSQTWDDHDRSHRYAARDFGENYLNSLDENAIIFTNGDNDTFPLWYAQEVEGVRTDVRVVNLSYLTTEWYANQLRHPYYDAKPVKMTATPADYAFDRLQVVYAKDLAGHYVNAMDALAQFYANPRQVPSPGRDSVMLFTTPLLYMPVDQEKAIKAFGINPADKSDHDTKLDFLASSIDMAGLNTGGFSLNSLLSTDIIANSINDGFERPVYFASTVPSELYLKLRPYFSSTGMAYQVTPFLNAPASPLADKSYENIVSKYKWGGLDDPRHNKGLYLDETVRRMVTSVRNSIVSTAADLIYHGDLPATAFAVKWAEDHNLPVPKNRYDMGRYLLQLMDEKLPPEVSPYEGLETTIVPEYIKLYRASGDPADLAKARQIIDKALNRYAGFLEYTSSLSPDNFNNLSNDAMFTRINLPNLLAYKYYADVLEKVMAIKDEDKRWDYLDLLNEFADIDYIYIFYRFNPYLFMDDYSAEQIFGILKDAGGNNSDYIAQYAYVMLTLGEDLDVDRMAGARKVFNGRRVKPSEIHTLDPFLPKN